MATVEGDNNIILTRAIASVNDNNKPSLINIFGNKIADVDENGNVTLVGFKNSFASIKDGTITTVPDLELATVGADKKIRLTGGFATLSDNKISILGDVVATVDEDGSIMSQSSGEKIATLDSDNQIRSLDSGRVVATVDGSEIRSNTLFATMSSDGREITMLGEKVATVDENGDIKLVSTGEKVATLNRETRKITTVKREIGTIENNKIKFNRKIATLSNDGKEITILGNKVADVDKDGNITSVFSGKKIATLKDDKITTDDLNIGTIDGNEIKLKSNIGKIDKDTNKITILGKEIGSVEKDGDRITAIKIGIGEDARKVISTDNGEINVEIEVGKVIELEDEVLGVDNFAVPVSDDMYGKYLLYYYIDSGSSGSLDDALTNDGVLES